jgi:hypothetical protein
MMPKAHDEELGRRLFITNREKAVEEALRKIRHSLGHTWDIFSPSDLAALAAILGELWVSVGREEWGTFTFSRLGRDDVETLIAAGKEMEKNPGGNQAIIAGAKVVLQKTV